MDLGNWLRTLGLERFEGTFRENAIDETVLSDLTEDHLRELGLPLGARIKLLKAIKALSRETAIDASAEMAISGSPSDACRAPTDHRDVQRSRGLHGAVDAHGPGGF